ncbi:MAG: hypothetical protein R3E48_11515 [Burkholderiaceae bacterium]
MRRIELKKVLRVGAGIRYLSRIDSMNATCSGGRSARTDSRVSPSGMPIGIMMSQPNGRLPTRRLISASFAGIASGGSCAMP